MMRLGSILCICILAGLAAGSVAAGDYTLNGSAALKDGAVRLTGSAWQAGSAFWKAPLNITKFDTTFAFRLHADGLDGMADGFTFCIHNDPRGASALGTAGGGLAYGSDGKRESSAPIRKSVAVEFDNYCNTGDGFPDPNYDHIGLDIDGSAISTAAAKIPFDITGEDIQVRIRYDGKWLEVFIWRAGEEPSAPLFRQDLNIPRLVGADTAHVGFTGGTGRWFQNQDISGWSFNQP